MRRKRKFILPQMFDIKPVSETGDLDLDRIGLLKKIVKLEPKKYVERTLKRKKIVVYDVKKPGIESRETERFKKVITEEKNAKNVGRHLFVPVKPIDDCRVSQEVFPEISRDEIIYSGKDTGTGYFDKFETKNFKELRKNGAQYDKFFNLNYFYFKRFFPSFAIASVLIMLGLMSINVLGRGLGIKSTAFNKSERAFADLANAKENLAQKNFRTASMEFSEAGSKFKEISDDVDSLGSIVVETSKYLPFVSKVSSGAYLAKAGEDISAIGLKLTNILATLESAKNGNESGNQKTSLLGVFQETDRNIKEVSGLLNDLEANVGQINVKDVPDDKREKFIELKKKLPEINNSLDVFVVDSHIFNDILGGNGPRKYLFLFQNNQEMRATGGFIGTYGVLDIFNGHVRSFFIDGIFNPDGQLKEKIVPPTPIQKISAAWSLHDSNWFPDFPVSAEKSAWFYEKTGGPTVDGVITMTPTVLEKLLDITGPVEMPEYGVTVDKDNFVKEIQYEVEVDYDRELNEPKKILADLASRILEDIFNERSVEDFSRVISTLIESFDEKHILIYSKNHEIEKILSQRGWSGEVLASQRDYLSVINTNINGFKTDGVIDEEISHQAEIREDGSIIDTVKITRHHKGGNSDFDWWNKVNADYMRVYVPKGSQLLSVSGQTREFNSSPLDYKALGFKSDPQVEMEESMMKIDEESGTRVYEDSDKTVFANWVYVSPQESAEVTYSYLLPFKVKPNSNTKPADTYSLVVQKQSGSIGSKFNSKLIRPDSFRSVWKYPEDKSVSSVDTNDDEKEIIFSDVLETDKYFGAAFMKK